MIPTPALAAAATFVVTAAITFVVLKHMHGAQDQPINPVSTPAAIAAQDNNRNPVETPTNEPPHASGRPTQPTVSTTVASYGGRSTAKNFRPNVETPTADVPGVTILLRDGQRGEQVMRVPQVIVGARSVVPRGSSAKRPQYEPSVF
jgi:hypothetical protein